MAGVEKTILLDEKAWSASGDLFYPGADGTRRRSAVSIQADFKRAGFYTLQFGVTPPLASGGFDISGNVVAQAEILWSVKGNFVRRFINVYNGTTISGAGEGVLVRIRDSSEPNVFVANPTKYQVTVNLIPGARPTMAQSMPPIFTPRELLTSLVAPPALVAPPYPLPVGPDQLLISVPKDCGVTSVMLNFARETDEASTQPLDITNSQVIIRQQNASGELNWLNYDSAFKFMPLAPGTTRIGISNQVTLPDPSDIGLLWVTPIFGIDG